MKRFAYLLLAAVLLLPGISLSAKKGKAADLKVISYNIRLGSADDGTNSWKYRYPASAMMIMDQKPDIFGLQVYYRQVLQSCDAPYIGGLARTKLLSKQVSYRRKLDAAEGVV